VGDVTRLAGTVAAAAALVLLAACSTGEDPSRGGGPAPTTGADSPATATTPPTPGSETGSATPSVSSPAPVAEFDARAAMALVRELAALGPREATSSAYRRAARLVAGRLEGLGYEVRRQRFPVPAGESWGVPVGSGRTSNVVARLPGEVGAQPYVVVGAHLDTVPQAPGAEDNASGVAVLVELADLAARLGTRRPVTFVVFGAEEPRGPADDEHHFGSQAYVRREVERGAAVAAMVSLDRVGTPGPVPVCTGGLSRPEVRRELLAAADRVGVAARPCENRTSDHWPFEKAGETVARIGGTDYPEYHSARDLPRVVSERQLDRVGRVVWEWLRVP
jgi:hypothetical protein